MSALARLQRDFAAALFDESVPARPGLEVYRGNLVANRRAALAATYPVVRRLVGDAFFDEAAARYARAIPSASADLHEYGGELARFLEDYPHARALPYLPDVARLEWACHESHHAADAEEFDHAALTQIPAERHGELRFHLHPSVRLLRSAYAVVAIHAANQPGRDGAPERLEGDDHAVVHRRALRVEVDRVAPSEWVFISRLARGDPLRDACEAPGDGEALARYVECGVISGWTLAPDPA